MSKLGIVGATALSLALAVATPALAEGRGGGGGGMHAGGGGGGTTSAVVEAECASEAAVECTSVAVGTAVLKQASALAELAP